MKTAMLGKVIKPEKKTQKEYYMIREGLKLSPSYSVLKCCGVLSDVGRRTFLSNRSVQTCRVKRRCKLSEPDRLIIVAGSLHSSHTKLVIEVVGERSIF